MKDLNKSVITMSYEKFLVKIKFYVVFKFLTFLSDFFLSNFFQSFLTITFIILFELDH